jgi:hypothetical protein
VLINLFGFRRDNAGVRAALLLCGRGNGLAGGRFCGSCCGEAAVLGVLASL